MNNTAARFTLRRLAAAVCVFVVWLLAVAGSRAASSQDDDVEWALFYSANRHGTIEPCGCKGKRQGGLQNEALLYREHSAAGGIVRLDAGGWLHRHTYRLPIEWPKARTLLRGLEALGFDAVNVGADDLHLSRRFLKDFGEAHPKALEALVSANVMLKDDPSRHAFATHRLIELGDARLTVGVTGVAVPKGASVETTRPQPSQRPPDPAAESADFMIVSPRASLEPVLEMLAEQVDYVVVLCDGSFDTAVALAQAFPQRMNAIVVTNAPQRDLKIKLEGAVHILPTPDHSGKALGRLAFRRDAKGVWQPEGHPTTLDVSRHDAPDPALVRLVQDYKTLVSPPDDLPKRIERRDWAGAFRCRQCHETPYRAWRLSPHGRATRSLSERDRQFDKDCMACHTTAFGRSNGFYHVTHPASLTMQDVQCEMCHGPAMEHANAQSRIRAGSERWMKADLYADLTRRARDLVPPTTITQTTCLTCHTDERPEACGAEDEPFDFESAVRRLGHPDGKR